MKKLTMILMLIATLLVGSATVDSKTTTKKKSTSTKTTKKTSSSVKFGPKLFIKENAYNNFINPKGVSYLKQLGFKVTKTLPDIKHKREFDDAAGMWIPASVNKQYVYSKDGINVKVEQTKKGNLEDFTIEFPNSSETEKFVTQLKSAGYKLIYHDGGKDYFYQSDDTAGSWGFIRQNNTITPEWGGE